MHPLTTWTLALALRTSEANTVQTPMSEGLAEAIVDESIADEWDTRTLIAVLTEMAWDESGYNEQNKTLDTDGNWACGPFSTHYFAPYTCNEVRFDPHKAVKNALKWLHISASMCPEHPLAPYAGGDRAGRCSNASARHISDFRMQRAAKNFAATPFVWSGWAP